MTSLIINMPHLQRRRDRHGALLCSLLCWAWFLMPLVIVAGWMMGFHVFAQEIVWLGGWRSLVHLAGISVTIIVALAGGWLFWTVAELRAPAQRLRSAQPVTARDVASAFGVEQSAIAAARHARVTRVIFNEIGGIKAIIPDRSYPRTASVTSHGDRDAAVA